MDQGKSDAILAWVNALKLGPPAQSMRDFLDGTLMAKIVAACAGDVNTNNNNDILTPEDTTLSRMCAVEEFLQGFYQTRLGEKLNLEAIVENGDEFEAGKALMLLFGAAVQSSNRQHFVQLAMTLTNDQQSEIKDIIEPLLMKEGMNLPVIPDEYHSVLKTKTTISPPIVRPPVARNLYVDSPLRAVQNEAFPDSPLTPIKNIVQSPQMAFKVRLRDCEKKIRDLEAVITEERHLRSEMEWQLQEKSSSLTNAETRLQDQERRLAEIQEIKDKLDEMEALKMDKSRIEADNEKLRTKLNDFGQVKTNFQHLSKENEELLQNIFTLQDQLKDSSKLKEVLAASEERLGAMEERFHGAERSVEERNRRIQILEENLREMQREMESAREAHRENLLQTEERLGLSVMESPFGESMSCFTQKRVGELESEIKALIDHQESITVQLDKTKADFDRMKKHNEMLVNEKLEIEEELAASNVMIDDSETKMNNLTLQIGQLNAEMVELKTERSELQIKFYDEQESHEQDVIKLRKELKRKELDLDSEVREYRSIIDGMKEEYKSKRAEIEQCFEEKVKTLQDQQAQISDLNSKLIDNMNTLSEKNQGFQRKLLDSDRKLNEARGDVKEREKTIDQLKKVLGDKNDLLANLRNELEEVRSEMDITQKLLLSSEAEEARLKLNVQELVSEKVTLHEELGTLRSELNSKFVELSTAEAKLHNWNEDHEEEKADFRNRISDLEGDIKTKNKELSTLRANCCNLRSTIEEQEQSIKLLESERDKIHLEKTELLEVLQQRAVDLDAKTESIDELVKSLQYEREIVGKYNSQCKNFQASLNSLEDEKVSLQNSILVLESKLSVKEDEFGRLEKEKSELSSKLDGSGEAIAKLRSEKVQIQSEIDSLISSQQAELEAWTKQMAELNVEIDTLKEHHRAELETLAGNLSAAKEEMANMELRFQEEVANLQQKLQRKNVEMAVVESEVLKFNELLECEIQLKGVMEKEFKKKLAEKDAETVSLRSEIALAEDAHQQKLKDKVEQVSLSEDLIRSGNEKVAKMESLVADLQASKDSIVTELQAEKEKSAKLETQIQELENKIKEVIFTAEEDSLNLNVELGEKIREIEKLEEEKLMLQSLSQSQHEQLEEIHKSHAELESNHLIMKENKNALEYVHSELENNFNALEAANGRLLKEVRELKESIIEKNAEFDKARETMVQNYMSKFDVVSKAKSEVQRRYEEAETIITSLKAKIDLLESDRDKLEKKLNELQKEDQEKFDTLEKELSENIEMIASLNLELNETHRILEHKTEKVRQLQAENEELGQELKERDEFVSTLKESVNVSENQVAERNAKIVEFEEHCKALETSMNERVVRMQDRLNEQIQEFLTIRRDKDQEFCELSSKMTENEAELAEMTEKCEKLKETNANQAGTIFKLETTKTELIRQLESRDITISFHLSSLTDMESRLEKMTSHKVCLERQIQEKDLKNRDLETELEEASHKSTKLQEEYETRLAALKANMADSQTSLLNLTSGNSELLRKLEHSGQQIAKMELAKIELGSEHESRINKLTAQVTTLENSILHLERKNMSYRSECLELQEALNQKIQDVKEYESKAGSDNDVISSLQNIISGLQSEKSDLQMKVSAKDELVTSLKSDIASLQASKSHSEQNLCAEKDKTRSLESRCHHFQTKLQHQEAKCSDLEEKLKNERKTTQDRDTGTVSGLERRLDVETQLKSKFHLAFQKEEDERKFLEGRVERLKGRNADLESEVRRLRAEVEWSKAVPKQRGDNRQPSPPSGRTGNRSSLNDSLESGIDHLKSPSDQEETLRNSAGKLTIQHLGTDDEEFVSATRVFGSESVPGRYRDQSTGSSVSSSQQSITSDTSRRLQHHMGALFSCEDEPEDFQWNRLSELQRRNTLCPPHMKSSYPVETQSQPAQLGRSTDDLLMTSSRPNKYEQAMKTSTSSAGVKRHASGDNDDDHLFLKPSGSYAASYAGCHRTIPAEIRNSRVAQSYDFAVGKTKDETNIVSVATPSKGFRTPKSKKLKSLRGSSKKKIGKKSLAEASDTENETYNRRESVRFEIPFSDKKSKRLGLGFGRKKEKTESKSESKSRQEKTEMPPPRESPKILRRPLNARNFLM